jgi:hypothetical protein
MKDFLGNELAIGDEVVHTQMDGAGLNRGIIISLGPKKATIQNPVMEVSYREYIKNNPTTGLDEKWVKKASSTTRFYEDIVKVIIK